MVTPQDILQALKQVKYPGFTRDIVSFGIVKDIEVGGSGVTVHIAPTTDDQDAIEQIRQEIERVVAGLTGMSHVEIVIQHPRTARGPAAGRGPTAIPGIKHIVAVASGKGGVGKSTVAVNLALALSSLGSRVGLLDADVYGPSIPMMLAAEERPRVAEDRRITPIEKYGIKAISIGFFVGESTPVIWRGPMINKLLTEFLKNVMWEELDCLVVDLPPGTGDAQLTMVQQVPLSGGVIVTTPQDVALLDVKRGVTMFGQVNTPVLGVIENMSYYICSCCGRRIDIFGHGGGKTMARQFGIPFLGEIPLLREIREGGDAGKPLVTANPHHPQTLAFKDIAAKVAGQLEDR